MCDAEKELDKKRKRSDKSSLSELDTSIDSPKPQKGQKKKIKKKEKSSKIILEETTKSMETENTQNIEELDIASPSVSNTEQSMESIHTQLKLLNEKLSKVLTKDDPDLKNMIKQTFSELKEDFLKSVTHRLDTLEGRIFDTETENDQLHSRIQDLEKKLKNQECEKNQLKRDLEKKDVEYRDKLNEQEQYSRRNSLRIDGVTEVANETAETTISEVVMVINKQMKNVNIKEADIDIAHRIGKKNPGKRQIIVKFVSRMTRNKILQNKKVFKGTKIFINEDLTSQNQLALSCARKKQPDEVESAWSFDGRIKYKNLSGNVHTLKFEEFQSWFDLPWPAAKSSE